MKTIKHILAILISLTAITSLAFEPKPVFITTPYSMDCQMLGYMDVTEDSLIISTHNTTLAFEIVNKDEHSIALGLNNKSYMIFKHGENYILYDCRNTPFKSEYIILINNKTE